MHGKQMRNLKMLGLWWPNVKYKHHFRDIFSNHIPIFRVWASCTDRLAFVVVWGDIYMEETDIEGFQWAAVWLHKEAPNREGQRVSSTLTHHANDSLHYCPHHWLWLLHSKRETAERIFRSFLDWGKGDKQYFVLFSVHEHGAHPQVDEGKLMTGNSKYACTYFGSWN